MLDPCVPHGWLHMDFVFLIFIYRTQCIIPLPSACTPPEEPESASNAFSLADCCSVLTWELLTFSLAKLYVSSVIDICASELRVWLRIRMGLWIFQSIFRWVLTVPLIAYRSQLICAAVFTLLDKDHSVPWWDVFPGVFLFFHLYNDHFRF